MSYECEFDKLRKDLVKDILVVGIKNIQLKERLLREDNLDLDKAVSICKTAEITSERIKTLDSAAKSLKEEPVYHVQKFNNVVQSRNVSPRKNNRVISCFRCGESGHYANRCRRGRQHNRRVVNLCTREPVSEFHYQDENTQDEGSQYFVGVVGKSYSKPCDWFETVIINDIHFKSKIDTGAQVNIMPVKLFLQLKLSYDIIKRNTNIKLKTLSGSLPVIGTVLLRCVIGNNIHLIEFVVVEVDCVPLLGLPTCQALDLVQRKMNTQVSVEAHSIQSLENNAIVAKYKDVFNGVGKGELQTISYQAERRCNTRIDGTRKVPFALYKPLREELQRMENIGIIEKVIAPTEWNEDGVEPYIDDIIVCGKTVEEHDEKLEKVLCIARENNIRFNPEKCVFNVSQVKFLGHVIDGEGVHIDDEKVKAIMSLPVPANKKELERFLGSMNYLSKFIQNYSSKSAGIRDLLNKNNLGFGMKTIRDVLKELKKCISNTPVLKFYDVNQDVTLSVDSSSYGIGCVLLQDGQPVAFSSRALNSSQKNYAQVEKEMMAILICYPVLLFRWKKQVSKNDEIIDIDNDVICQVDLVHKNVCFSSEKLAKLKEETDKDTCLSKLKAVVKEGWPHDKTLIDKELLPFWNFRDEINIIDDVLFK
ncbi:hypothetical protein WDU94_006279 [Cyamophila willieti]